MALINRVSQLFKADFNAVLDHIEEPEQLLKQAVRDMEDELTTSENRIATCAQEQESLLARKRELEESVGELAEKLDLCFESGKDDLARGVIRRKLESERLIQRLSTRLDANEAFLERERKFLAENRTTLEGLRQKAELFVSAPGREDHISGGDEFSRRSSEMTVGDDEIEIALLREKSARGGS